MNNKSLTPEAVSVYFPQFFLGFFFLAAAYIKATEGLFGPHPSSLAWILEGWKSTSHFMPSFYFGFADAVLIPHANFFAITVIVIQALVGMLLVSNRFVRLAGALLFFVQFNIFLATYNQLELRVFNGQAMLIGIYFFARSDMRSLLWTLMTYSLVLIGLVHLYGRFVLFGDAWMQSYYWQRPHFSAYVMSAWPGLKYFTLWLTSEPLGPLLWASAWWIKLVLILGMLTRYRLQCGIAWFVFVTVITMTWLNAFSCEGVFWVLTMYLWVTHEHQLQKMTPETPVSLLP